MVTPPSDDRRGSLHAGVCDVVLRVQQAVHLGAARLEQRGQVATTVSSPYRVRTILRTNIQTAYSAGRYRRQRETAAALPYWRYSAVLDANTRFSHAEMDGVVYRADNPIWRRIYPPNGFNCRCTVRALTEREVQARGLTVIEGTDAPGGFTPAEGWDYNPGEAAWPVG